MKKIVVNILGIMFMIFMVGGIAYGCYDYGCEHGNQNGRCMDADSLNTLCVTMYEYGYNNGYSDMKEQKCYDDKVDIVFDKTDDMLTVDHEVDK